MKCVRLAWATIGVLDVGWACVKIARPGKTKCPLGQFSHKHKTAQKPESAPWRPDWWPIFVLHVDETYSCVGILWVFSLLINGSFTWWINSLNL